MTRTARLFTCLLPILALATILTPAGQAHQPPRDLFEGSLLTPDAQRGTISSCREAQLWVSQNEGRLPKDYATFTSLPPSHRKAAYRTFTSSERQQLWQAQWLRELRESEDSTEEQTEILLEALQLLSAETFGALDAKRGWRYEQALEQLRSFEERALAAFGKEGARELFAQIGPVRLHRVVVLDASVAPSPFSTQLLAEACGCSSDSDFCPDGYGCGGDGDGCDTIRDECGFLWTYDCNGECLRPN